MRVRLPIKMYPAVSLPTVRTGGGWRLSTARSGEKPGPSTILYWRWVSPPNGTFALTGRIDRLATVQP